MAELKVVAKKGKDGRWTSALLLPEGDGSLAAVAKGMTAADATVKAARVARAAGVQRSKAAGVQAVAAVAKNPILRDALAKGGLEAAKMAAAAIPGGAVALKALELAAKFKPARKLLSSLVKPFGRKKKAKKR